MTGKVPTGLRSIHTTAGAVPAGETAKPAGDPRVSVSTVVARPTPVPRRARGAYRAVREGRPSVQASDRSTEAEIASLTETPFESIVDAHGRLTALERCFRERDDYRGAFLVVYARVTEAVGEAIDTDAFADPAWVADYLVTFADLYRRALVHYEEGDLRSLPDPWQVAFETAERGECLASQAAVLGINAHVNYDLALALCEVGIDPDRDLRYADHCAVNDVLRAVVDDVQTLLADGYAPGIADLDERLGRIDEALGFLTLAEGRDSAWRSAVAMNSRFRVRRRFARWFLRVSSTGAAYAILSPTAAPGVLEALRRAEGSAEAPQDTP